MKIVASNEKIDIISGNIDKKDIVSIILIENATIKDKKTNIEYFNGSFLKITNRKGNIRVLDLKQNIDITNMLKRLEVVYSKKTTENVLFMSN